MKILLNETAQVINITKQLKKRFAIKISYESIQSKIINHPYPNSIFSISNGLRDWNIDNLLIQLLPNEFERIKEFNFPFVSTINENNIIEYILVNKIENNVVTYQKTEIEVKESFEIFLKHWSGLALLVFPNEKSGEKNFATKNNQNILKKTVSILFFVGILFSIIGFLTILFQSNLGLQGVFLVILKLIGLSICSLLILNDFDSKDSIVNRVCSTGKSDCNRILTDKNAKLFGFINWSELGLIYFGGSLLFLFFSIGKLSDTIQVIGFLNLSCVLFSFYSLWYQAFKSKEWCYFCLATLAVFWLEFAVLLPLSSWTLPTDWQVYIMVLLSFVGMITLTIFVTSFLEKKNKLKDAKSELNLIKYDSALFNQLLQSEKTYKTEEVASLRVFGENEAQNSIVIITNPLCKPCFTTHSQLTDYINGSYESYQINLIFTIRDYSDTNSEDYKIAKRIMALYRYEGQEAALHAMESWYDSDNPKTFSTWEFSHPVENEDVEDLILSQKKWCEENTVSFTPTVIINQKQLPKYYQVSDLKYFMD